jgi:hypothetical protein
MASASSASSASSCRRGARALERQWPRAAVSIPFNRSNRTLAVYGDTLVADISRPRVDFLDAGIHILCITRAQRERIGPLGVLLNAVDWIIDLSSRHYIRRATADAQQDKQCSGIFHQRNHLRAPFL